MRLTELMKKREAINLKENKESYMGRVGRKNGKKM